MKGGSFWSAPNSILGSWIWKKLLKLREDVKPFIRVEIGNGEDASFWFDAWMPQGSILHITGPTGPRQLGIPLHATVKEAIGLQGWKLRRSRSATLYPLIQAIRATPLPDAPRGKDQFLWKTDMDGFTGQFHSLKTWEQIRESHPQVPWGNLIWFRQGIPRCGFISWLAIQNRLSTGDRMRLWGQQQHSPSTPLISGLGRDSSDNSKSLRRQASRYLDQALLPVSGDVAAHGWSAFSLKAEKNKKFIAILLLLQLLRRFFFFSTASLNWKTSKSRWVPLKKIKTSHRRRLSLRSSRSRMCLCYPRRSQLAAPWIEWLRNCWKLPMMTLFKIVSLIAHSNSRRFFKIPPKDYPESALLSTIPIPGFSLMNLPLSSVVPCFVNVKSRVVCSMILKAGKELMSDSGPMNDEVRLVLLGTRMALFLEFAGRKFTQPIKDDIGDKSVFTFMSISEDEKNAIVEKLEKEKLG
ncbi:unnamed protein product [Arabidopsis lyrata]|nr:unnamed protein product [Arabidopsis lyrata]